MFSKELRFGKPRMTGINLSYYQINAISCSHRRTVDFRFVVVGKNTNTGNGIILYSSDGLNWTEVEGVFGYPFNDVKSDGISFIAVGEYGRVYHSPDGVVWKSIYAPLNNTNLTCVMSLREDNWFIGGAQGKVIQGSVSQEKWTELDTSLGIDDTVLDIWQMNESLWISAIDSALKRTLVTASKEQRYYSEVETLIVPERCSARRGDDFYGISHETLIMTKDGTTWEPTSQKTKTLVAGNGLFVTSHSKYIFLSRTLKDRSRISIGFEVEHLSYGNGIWLMMGDNMTKIATAYPVI